MIYGVYAIRDVKTGYLSPTVDFNDEAAVRNFEHACQNSNSLFFTHPKDYSLYKIGTFDSEEGLLDPFRVPKHLVDAQERKE